MGNMGYCMFENTYNDLHDCFEELNQTEISKMSTSEIKYAIKLIKLCKDISEGFLEEALEIEQELKKPKNKQDGN